MVKFGKSADIVNVNVSYCHILSQMKIICQKRNRYWENNRTQYIRV